MISNYQIPSILVGIFLRKLDQQDYKKMADQMPWRLPDLDAPPRIAQNVPPNAPKDATRAVFASADGRKVLEVAPAKLQFRMLPGELVEAQGNMKGLKPLGIKESFESFVPAVVKVYNVFTEHFGATGVRIGVLAELFAHLGASANQRMQSTLLAGKNHFGERLNEIQISALSKVSVADRGANRWIRVKPLRSNDEARADLAIGVEVDLNTMAEDVYDLTSKDIENFLNDSCEHIMEKIPLLHDTTLFGN